MNQADTAWMLISTALVLLMTPGLAFFYGGEPPSGDTAGGAGLGLSIAKRAVEAHRGSLALAETGPGGTTFRISLPLLAPAAQRAS